jgi:hypothetical protein
MNKRILAATAILAVTSVIATAQNRTPPTPAQLVSNKVARLTTLLDLTSAQQSTATTIFTTEETALATIRTSMHTARTALQTDIKNGNSADIAVEAAAIGSLTTQEVQAEGTADAAFYAILTGDQPSKYESLGRGPGGPGGFGGTGPHGFGTH